MDGTKNDMEERVLRYLMLRAHSRANVTCRKIARSRELGGTEKESENNTGHR